MDSGRAGSLDPIDPKSFGEPLPADVLPGKVPPVPKTLLIGEESVKRFFKGEDPALADTPPPPPTKRLRLNWDLLALDTPLAGTPPPPPPVQDAPQSRQEGQQSLPKPVADLVARSQIQALSGALESVRGRVAPATLRTAVADPVVPAWLKTAEYLGTKLKLEIGSFKNWGAVAGVAFTIGNYVVTHNIGGSVCVELVSAIIGVWMATRAYVDGKGNGPQQQALQIAARRELSKSAIAESLTYADYQRRFVDAAMRDYVQTNPNKMEGPPVR